MNNVIPLFSSFWESISDEEALNIISHPACPRETGDISVETFQVRRAASRLLARRRYEPAADVFIQWLKDPEKGIGQYVYGYEHSAQHNEWPDDYLFADDSTPKDIICLAAESLGLMRYQPARNPLEILAVSHKEADIATTIMNSLRRIDGILIDEGDIDPDSSLYLTAFFPQVKGEYRMTVVNPCPKNIC